MPVRQNVAINDIHSAVISNDTSLRLVFRDVLFPIVFILSRQKNRPVSRLYTAVFANSSVSQPSYVGMEQYKDPVFLLIHFIITDKEEKAIIFSYFHASFTI